MQSVVCLFIPLLNIILLYMLYMTVAVSFVILVSLLMSGL